MAEKSSGKVRLGTPIYISLIVLLVIAICIVCYLKFINKNNNNNYYVLVNESNQQDFEGEYTEIPIQEQTLTNKKEFVYGLAMEEIAKNDLLYLDDGTIIEPDVIEIKNISIMDLNEFEDALIIFYETKKEDIELMGTINYFVEYPEEYNGQGTKDESDGLKYFIVTKVDGEYKIEIATGL